MTVGRRRALLPTLAVALLVITGCTDDGGWRGVRGEVVATVDGAEITRDQVEQLVDDPAFRELIGADEVDGELSTSDAGRTTLQRLIQEQAIVGALERAEVEVRDEALDEAEDALGSAEASELQRDTRATLTDALAAYLTLDQALRDGSGGPSLSAQGIVDEFPALATRHCGTSLAVAPEAQAQVDAELTSGVSLPDVAVPTGLIARTGQGVAECGLEVAIPSAARPAIIGVPSGRTARTPVGRTRDGDPAVFYATPADGGSAGADEVEEAEAAFDQRLRTSGHTAWWDVVSNQVEVDVDPSWGSWTDGGQLLDAPLEPTTIVPTGSTTTTTTAPPSTAAPDLATAPFLAEDLFAVSDPGTSDLTARGEAALDSGVPDAWSDAVPVRLSVIDGTTSYSYPDGRLELASYHVTGPWDRLQAVTGHELGHHIAFRYGTQEESGAPPAGWPSSGDIPVERWGDCVARAFSGYQLGSHGQGPCSGDSLDWTVVWLAAGPSSHPRTG